MVSNVRSCLIKIKKTLFSSNNRKLSVKLHQIQTLVAIAETGSVRAAARRLGLTQPALSKSLAALEMELSVPLVHRTARGANLTKFGQSIVIRGRGISQEIERMREEIEQMRGAERGGVTVAISPSPAMLLLPAVLQRFHKEFPDIQVRVRECVYPDTVQLLREGLADFAVGAQPPARKTATSEFIAERLYENKLVVACRQGHPKANALSLLELLDCEWLQHGSADGPGSLYAPVFRENGFDVPKPWLVSDSFISTLSILESSDALSLLPAVLVEQLTQSRRLTALSLQEPMPDWDVALIMRTQTPQTRAALKLAQVFRRTPNSTRQMPELQGLSK
jgi:LysR family transcriptional regulator of abg operon